MKYVCVLDGSQCRNIQVIKCKESVIASTHPEMGYQYHSTHQGLETIGEERKESLQEPEAQKEHAF